VSTSPLRSATATAVVEQFPVRPRRLCPESIQGLASSLLDLCSSYEAALRTVISMQRNLERIRRCEEVSPEGALLLEEMGRQLQGLADGAGSLTGRLQTAGQHLGNAQGPANAGHYAEE
jgi:hypothetical protein